MPFAPKPPLDAVGIMIIDNNDSDDSELLSGSTLRLGAGAAASESMLVGMLVPFSVRLCAAKGSKQLSVNGSERKGHRGEVRRLLFCSSKALKSFDAFRARESR